MLKLTYNVSEPDRRYRALVMLNRDDRPSYWVFHCPRCQGAVAELANAKVIAITDLVDMSIQDRVSVGYRCGGKWLGSRCGIWFYFTLNEK